MGIFDIFKKSSDEKTVIANLLDPNDGHTQHVWTVGIEIDRETVDRLSERGNLYVVVAYVDGRQQMAVCKKSIWEGQKAAYDRIEKQLNDSPALRMLAEFRKNQEK